MPYYNANFSRALDTNDVPQRFVASYLMSCHLARANRLFPGLARQDHRQLAGERYRRIPARDSAAHRRPRLQLIQHESTFHGAD